MRKIKWPTVAAIAVLSMATLLGWYWVWGLLFIFWAFDGMRSGAAFVVETVERTENPILFWIINAMWAGSGFWALITDLSWRFA